MIQLLTSNDKSTRPSFKYRTVNGMMREKRALTMWSAWLVFSSVFRFHFWVAVIIITGMPFSLLSSQEKG